MVVSRTINRRNEKFTKKSQLARDSKTSIRFHDRTNNTDLSHKNLIIILVARHSSRKYRFCRINKKLITKKSNQNTDNQKEKVENYTMNVKNDILRKR